MKFNWVACAIASPIVCVFALVAVRILEASVLGWDGMVAPLLIAAAAAMNAMRSLERSGMWAEPYPSGELDLNPREQRPLDLEQRLRRRMRMKFHLWQPDLDVTVH